MGTTNTREKTEMPDFRNERQFITTDTRDIKMIINIMNKVSI